MDKNGLAVWFSGDTNINTLLDKIPSFGEKLKLAGESLKGLSLTTFDNDVTIALNALERMASIFTFQQEGFIDYGGYGSYDLYEAFNSLGLDATINGIETIGKKIKAFSDSTAEVDMTRFTGFMDSVSSIMDSLTSASTADPNAAVNNIETCLINLQKLLSGEGDVQLDSSAFLSGLDSADIVDTLSTFTTSVTTALNGSTETISGYVESFNNAGTALAGAINAGLGAGSADTSGVSAVCDAAYIAVTDYEEKFVVAGAYLGRGLRKGLKESEGLAKIVAKGVALAMLKAAKEALGIESPSKEFAKLGMYSDKGLAQGLNRYSKVVVRSASGLGDSALDAARGSLLSFSSMINEDMNTDPVVRPVVDLSNVSAASRGIDGLLSQKGRISVGMSASLAQAGAQSMTNVGKRQNGKPEQNSEATLNNDSSVNLTGNNFYIRSDNDIHLLSAEIAALTRQQQRSLGGT